MDESDPLRARPRRRWGAKFWIKLVISVSLFAWIVSRAELAPVFAALSGVNLTWFALAFCAQILGAAIISLRWRVLLAAGDITPGYGYLFASTLSSLFFRQFLPSVIGGDALRAHDAWRAGASSSFAVLSLVVDRLLGLLALALFAVLAFAGAGAGTVALSNMVWPLLIGTALILGILAWLLLGRRQTAPRWMPKGITEKLASVTTALRVYRGQHRVFLKAGALSVLLQINVVTFYWMLSKALALEVPYGAFYIIVPLAIFVMMLPISINGIGLRETAFVFLLGAVGVGDATALAFAWIEFGLILLVGGFGGVVYLLRPGPKARPETTPSA